MPSDLSDGEKRRQNGLSVWSHWAAAVGHLARKFVAHASRFRPSTTYSGANRQLENAAVIATSGTKAM